MVSERDRSDNEQSTVDSFLNLVCSVGFVTMGLSVVGVLCQGGVTIPVNLNNGTTEVNQTIQQIGIVNINFGSNNKE